MKRAVVPAVLFLVLAAACSDNDQRADSGPGPDGPQVTDVGVPDGPEACDELLPESFPQDTVLAKGCYLCKKTPQIADGVKITMQPGVKIVFFSETALNIADDEVLIAAGTASEPIVFTGAVKQRGHWRGVSFDGTLKPDSKLDHVTIEYAGDTKFDTDAAGLKLNADSRGVRASITNTTIRESEGWGLRLGGSAVVGAFAGNTLTQNTFGPALVGSEVVSTLDAASTYTGNDRDELVVAGGSTSGTWATLDVPYYLKTNVYADGEWTIAAGATLIMADGTSLESAGNANALIAKGTAAKPILFTGATKKRGAWKGISFDTSNNAKNALAYATVEYAGNTTSDKDAAAVKLTADSQGVQLSMSNTTLHESQGWGLYLAGSAVLPGFSGNTLTKNTLGPVIVDSEAVHQLLPSSSYGGNDVDRVVVKGGYISASVTWSDLKVPYLVRSHLRPYGGVLTIAPGVTLLMDDKAYIEVGEDSSGLHAVGTAAAPITVTSLKKTAGAWESIVFDTTLNSANAIEYCTVEYGGGGTAKGWNGMVVAKSDSHGVSVSLANSKLQHSAVYCVWQGLWAGLSLGGTTFASCASGEIFKQR